MELHLPNAKASQAFAEVADRLSKRKLNKSALVSSYYGGLYFNYHHAIALDVLLSKVDTLPLDLQDLGKAIILSPLPSALSRTVGQAVRSTPSAPVKGREAQSGSLANGGEVSIR